MPQSIKAFEPGGVIAASSPTLGCFELRCWARAYLVEHRMMSLQEAVDDLQDSAVSSGLVERLGQDAIQALMAKAFDPFEVAR